MTESLFDLIAQSSLAALLLLVVGYLCRNLIEARLTRSVQYEFDKKLAAFKQGLEEEARRLEAVRNAGFAALAAQRNSLASKRVEAAQGLWNGILEARKGIGVAQNLEIMNLDAVVKELGDPRMQLFLKTIAPAEILNPAFSVGLGQFSAHQPFVSPTAWALYAAYSTIIVFSVSKMHVLQNGYDPRKFLLAAHWTELLGEALTAEDFKRIGTSSEYGIQWALKRIEDRLVDELRRSIASESAGLESLDEAHRILLAVDKLQNAASTAKQKLKEGNLPDS
jgi:hypothetical protein